ncbi:hypothetical protein BD289DRAFT_457095 [Coniella lustricola]|uniref:Peptidase S1 domain-containing protein n=1 Tax=Coniella lustricola TaxID=2025994 RepID=A0A2T2ZTA4_9PEZI|nr:hypothetical protein BD289DRAFT_457095 [Coniella lustricola]
MEEPSQPPNAHSALSFADVDEPYQPGAEEQAEYYDGLAGKPRLVARSSTHRWSMPPREFSWDWGHIGKRYAPIQECEQLVEQWTTVLALDVAAILKNCAWNFFVPIRIGMENEAPRQYPTVLLVGVARNTLDWDRGIAVALECYRRLQAAHIQEMHVEICELAHISQAASTDLEGCIDASAWCDVARQNTNQSVLPLLSGLGFPLAYDAEIHRQGTLGLYVQLSGDVTERTYGLTCRHVVVAGRSPLASYKASESDNPASRQVHVQADQPTFEWCLQQLRDRQQELDGWVAEKQRKETRWNDWYCLDPAFASRRPTEEDKEQLERLRAAAAYNKKVLAECSAVSNKSSRRVGSLAFLPTLRLSEQRLGFLTDWGLVAFDMDKFSHKPENKVVIDQSLRGHFLPRIKNNLLQLRLSDQDSPSEKRSKVAKRGSRTGLTMGTRSSIEAVVRHPDVGSESECLAWEMLIIPPQGQDRFSANGDSGAAVFDTEGIIVGMVTASTREPADDWRGVPGTRRTPTEHPGGNVLPQDAPADADLPRCPWGQDITFATPIEVILQDIERFTGLKPKLA